MQKKKVVVVGAGFAGITAARTLLAEATAPLEVVVLEASSRIGGRAHTMEVNLGEGTQSALLAAFSGSSEAMQLAARGLWQSRVWCNLVSWHCWQPTV